MSRRLSFFFIAPATTELYPYFTTLSLHDALPTSFAATPKALSASVTLVIVSLLRRVASSADAAIVLTPAVKRASSGRVSERPVADTDSKVSSCSTPRGSGRSEEHTSELQSLMRISYDVFCLKKKKTTINCKQRNNANYN